MVKLSSSIVDIQGRGPGGIWRSDNCGQHLQGEPRMVRHEPTAPQRSVRWAFFICVLHFFKKLTSEQQNRWWVYSYNHPITTSKGETRYMQPHNAFVSYNLKRVLAGKPPLDVPPVH